MSDVVLDSVVKVYGGRAVVNDVSLVVEQGEFLALLGPSGCGKSTTLRMIAGLEPATSGRVLVRGLDPSAIRPAQRQTKLVFQNYALFPHMSVYENIAFGLQLRRVPGAEVRRRVSEMLEMVGLTGRELSRPAELSGGEQQRVAICRVLVTDPKVLLLDEPFAALDAKIVKTMEIELKHLQKRIGISFVMVTHDQEQALTMADRMAVMDAGRLEQAGSPKEIYARPANLFVAGFVGEMNFFDAVVVAGDGDRCQLKVGEHRMEGVAGAAVSVGQQVKIAVRPESLQVARSASTGCAIPAVCSELIFRGSRRLAGLRLAEGDLAYAEVPEGAVAVGDAVAVSWKPDLATVLAS